VGNLTARTVEWLVYTCLLGLIPVVARLLVWSIASKGVEPLAVSDLVAFGLVLHSANIQQVGRLGGADPRWSAIHFGVSITFIVIYALLMFTTILPSSNLNANSILNVSIFLCVVSFIISFTVYIRLQAEDRSSA
jgi:hypothetical protein